MPRVALHFEDSLHQAPRLKAADTKQSASVLVNDDLNVILLEDL
tara:strand:- start:484 stop:615 length:132 start_codon:yes stop_codon:yes gene_type:complete